MQRRSFISGLAGIMAAGFAPAAVGSNILMPVKKIAEPKLILDSVSPEYVMMRLKDQYGNPVITWNRDETVIFHKGVYLMEGQQKFVDSVKLQYRIH